jgi:hypothetical protein
VLQQVESAASPTTAAWEIDGLAPLSNTNITTVCIYGVAAYHVSGGAQDGHFSPVYSDENPTAEG